MNFIYLLIKYFCTGLLLEYVFYTSYIILYASAFNDHKPISGNWDVFLSGSSEHIEQLKLKVKGFKLIVQDSSFLNLCYVCFIYYVYTHINLHTS